MRAMRRPSGTADLGSSSGHRELSFVRGPTGSSTSESPCFGLHVLTFSLQIYHKTKRARKTFWARCCLDELLNREFVHRRIYTRANTFPSYDAELYSAGFPLLFCHNTT
jgi:hypothetical protein